MPAMTLSLPASSLFISAQPQLTLTESTPSTGSLLSQSHSYDFEISSIDIWHWAWYKLNLDNYTQWQELEACCSHATSQRCLGCYRQVSCDGCAWQSRGRHSCMDITLMYGYNSS